MTKEEYLYSYGNIRDAMKNICLSCQENKRCKGCDIFYDLHNFRKIIHKHFELVEKYESLKEKNTSKKPNFEGDGYDDKGQLMYDTWICPNCEKHYELDYEEYDYCPHCGQKIDWSDKNVKNR